jgi:hypothetical protein
MVLVIISEASGSPETLQVLELIQILCNRSEMFFVVQIIHRIGIFLSMTLISLLRRCLLNLPSWHIVQDNPG